MVELRSWMARERTLLMHRRWDWRAAETFCYFDDGGAQMWP
jgi:hypothetical protein